MGKGKRTSKDKFDMVINEFQRDIKQEKYRSYPTMLERCIANGVKAKMEKQKTK
jgi:hypothetical protein